MSKDILQKYGIFSDADRQLLEEYLIKKQFGKNEILLHEGEICQSAFYILSGTCYQFRYEDINENIIDLHLPDEWLLNHSSFMSQKPSNTIIKSFTKVEVLELTMHAIHALIAKSPVYLQLGKILDQAATRIHFFDNDLSPIQKYRYVMENTPQILQAFPLKMIASYLKITPETLSRVRSVY